uniref:RING-type domain-containing protein n=1 Tax=Leersia perrieri TaxID=77586 RepID=A0A0D9XWT8_9ORYZ
MEAILLSSVAGRRMDASAVARALPSDFPPINNIFGFPFPQYTWMIGNQKHISSQKIGTIDVLSSTIADLQEVVKSGARDHQCVVCLEDFEEGEILTRIPCSHCFHENCIMDGLRSAISVRSAGSQCQSNCSSQ